MGSVLDLLQGHSILDVLHHERGELISEMPPAEVILSIGCADATYFKWFGSKYPHKVGRHIGIDIVPPPEDLPADIEWHQGSFADLSTIADGSIDLIFAGQAIEHVPTHECLTFLEHAHRVLRQDHWLIMDSPNFEITRVWPFPNPEHVIEYTPSQICSILKVAGFRVVRRKGILLAKEDGKLIDEPYEYERLDYRRLKDAKERPDESFIWWIEATKSGDFNRRRVARLLAEVNRSYERQRNRSTRKKPKAAQTGAAPTPSSAAAGNPTPSSGSIKRRVFRRVVPRRIRALMRGVYRLASGWYLRTVVQLLEDLKGQNVTQVAQIEAQSEILDLMLRRLRRLEDQVTASASSIEDQLTSLAEPLPNELTHRIVPSLNYDQNHLGFRARFGLWVNHPVAVEYSPEEVRWTFTNERVVEVPFVLQSLSALSPPARIIDVGSCESLVALELASLGYQVTAIDIRPYAYSHPNLAAVTASILDWEGDDRPYDCAIVLSTIEHLGLSVYGQTSVDEDADLRAMERIRSLLRPGGLLIMTSPFGMSHVEPTQRVYSQQDLSRLLEGFQINGCRVARRLDGKTWAMDGQVSFDGLAQLEKGNGTEQVVLLTAEKQ